MSARGLSPSLPSGRRASEKLNALSTPSLPRLSRPVRPLHTLQPAGGRPAVSHDGRDSGGHDEKSESAHHFCSFLCESDLPDWTGVTVLRRPAP